MEHVSNVAPSPELRHLRIVCRYRRSLHSDCIGVIQEGAPGAEETIGCCSKCLRRVLADAREVGKRMARTLDDFVLDPRLDWRMRQ